MTSLDLYLTPLGKSQEASTRHYWHFCACRKLIRALRDRKLKEVRATQETLEHFQYNAKLVLDLLVEINRKVKVEFDEGHELDEAHLYKIVKDIPQFVSLWDIIATQLGQAPLSTDSEAVKEDGTAETVPENNRKDFTNRLELLDKYYKQSIQAVQAIDDNLSRGAFDAEVDANAAAEGTQRPREVWRINAKTNFFDSFDSDAKTGGTIEGWIEPSCRAEKRVGRTQGCKCPSRACVSVGSCFTKLGNPRERTNSAQQEPTHWREPMERKEIRSENYFTWKHRERISRQDWRIATNFCKQRTNLRTSR